MSSQRDDLGVQVTRLSAERDALAAQDRAADEFASRVGPAAVRGLLAGQTVALVVAGADVQDRDAVAGLIGQAGGTVTGQVELTDAVGDPARADQLRELTSQLLPTGAQLPAASDTGSLVGGLLGGVLLARDGGAAVRHDDADSVLTGLTSAGFVQPGTPPGAASLVLVLTGGGQDGVDAADSAAVYARLAAQLDLAAAGAVLAGRSGSAGRDGRGRRRAGGPAGGGAALDGGRRAVRRGPGGGRAGAARAARRPRGQLRHGCERGVRRCSGRARRPRRLTNVPTRAGEGADSRVPAAGVGREAVR